MNSRSRACLSHVILGVALISMMAEQEDSVFVHSGNDLVITPQMKECFAKNGYIIVRSLISAQELQKLKSTLEGESEILKRSFEVSDTDGRKSRVSEWHHPGNDITGMLARCDKVAGTMDELIGGEVYHYHTKLMMKEAHTGGTFLWHQDYGYWYNYTCLFPDLATVFIAVDKTDRENGCLKVLKGSHKCGRIEHKKVGIQYAADTERVEMLEKVLPTVHVELEAGDALFFHCNVLHRSEKNDSNRRRWAFLVCYNCVSNNPLLPNWHPQYTPLNKVRNSSILDCECLDVSGKGFITKVPMLIPKDLDQHK